MPLDDADSVHTGYSESADSDIFSHGGKHVSFDWGMLLAFPTPVQWPIWCFFLCARMQFNMFSRPWTEASLPDLYRFFAGSDSDDDPETKYAHIDIDIGDDPEITLQWELGVLPSRVSREKSILKSACDEVHIMSDYAYAGSSVRARSPPSTPPWSSSRRGLMQRAIGRAWSIYKELRQGSPRSTPPKSSRRGSAARSSGVPTRHETRT